MPVYLGTRIKLKSRGNCSVGTSKRENIVGICELLYVSLTFVFLLINWDEMLKT